MSTNWNVVVELREPGSDPLFCWGRNAIQSTGLVVLRNALIGASAGKLDNASTWIYTDGNPLAAMDSGYPLEATAARPQATWQGQKKLTSALSFTNLQLAHTTADPPPKVGQGIVGVVAQVARTSLTPKPPSSIAVGTTIIVRWQIKASGGVLWSEVPGSYRSGDTKSQVETRAQGVVDAGARGMMNRLMGKETGSASGVVQVWRYPGLDPAAINLIGGTKAHYTQVGSDIAVTLSADGSKPRLVTSAFSYPAINPTGNDYFGDWNRYHTALLYLGTGASKRLVSVLLDDTSGIARPNATPGQTADILLANV